MADFKQHDDRHLSGILCKDFFISRLSLSEVRGISLLNRSCRDAAWESITHLKFKNTGDPSTKLSQIFPDVKRVSITGRTDTSLVHRNRTLFHKIYELELCDLQSIMLRFQKLVYLL
jgi:hypothetical protein